MLRPGRGITHSPTSAASRMKALGGRGHPLSGLGARGNTALRPLLTCPALPGSHPLSPQPGTSAQPLRERGRGGCWARGGQARPRGGGVTMKGHGAGTGSPRSPLPRCPWVPAPQTPGPARQILGTTPGPGSGRSRRCLSPARGVPRGRGCGRGEGDGHEAPSGSPLLSPRPAPLSLKPL